jgi:DNA-binding transcriptional ArsR family regulator
LDATLGGLLMLQIHFTSDDLGRTRVPSVPDVMWEAVNGVQLLQNREGRLIFDGWRRAVRKDARRTPIETAIRTFATLAPYAEYFPDFLTPGSPSEGIDADVDRVLSTPRRQLHEEMTRLATDRPLPGWAAGVAAGDPDTLHRVGTVIHRFHDVAIKPYLGRISAELSAECAERARVAIRGGTEALLDSFRPLMNWTPPVLNVRFPFTRTLHLSGRGLRLVPSFFCWRYPITLADPDLTPTLVYPIDHRPGWTPPRHNDNQPNRSGLAALIGSTRAVILEATADGCTTTQVARLARISPATASHHASVLRDANLITSQRDANTVVHTATPLGMALLNSTPPNMFEKRADTDGTS